MSGWYFIYAQWHYVHEGSTLCEKYHLPTRYVKMSKEAILTLPDGDTACERCKQLVKDVAL